MENENTQVDDGMKKGAFQIARKLFTSDIWLNKPSTWKVIWIYILGTVAHANERGYTRGHGFFTFTTPKQTIGSDITIDIVKKSLAFFRKSGMIRTHRSTRGVNIEVINYNVYQTLDNYRSTDIGTKEAPEKHQRSTTIHKNVNNEKNENNKIEIVGDNPIPREIANSFFESVKGKNEEYRKFVHDISTKYLVSEENIEREVDKFYRYWTELNPTGKKQRWQMEKTFEVKGRLATWFSRSNFIKNNKPIANRYEVGKA